MLELIRADFLKYTHERDPSTHRVLGAMGITLGLSAARILGTFVTIGLL
jgi:hypothetical protein